MKAVYDTNILVDYLLGVEAAREELARVEVRLISVISHIEVMVGVRNEDEEKAIRGFLGAFQLVELTTGIAREAIALRHRHRLKIPDAIIYATARSHGCVLVTRNTRDMKPEWPDIRVPYVL